MRAVLDTSVLIGADPLEAGLTTVISTVSIAELHFGLLVARDAPCERPASACLRRAIPMA